MSQLDLRNLTQAHLDECKPHLGACLYAAPCIIGTLIPPEERHDLDVDEEGDEICPVIAQLYKDKRVTFADHDQLQDAERMQVAFDDGNWDRVVEIAGKYITQ